MKTITAIASAAVFSALTVSAAVAAPSGAKALGEISQAAPSIVNVDFVQGHELIAGVAARADATRAQASAVMSQRYFDADMIITLGALALASGAFVAVGIAGNRRNAVVKPVAAPKLGWRDEVMQALEADLEQYSVELRHAA